MKMRTGLLIDLYELSMAEGYLSYRADTVASFELFIRALPKERSYFVVGGINEVLDYVLNLRFSKEDIGYLKARKMFSKEFLEYLERFRFTGDLWGMPEGTVVFAKEPMIRVKAPIIEAQILESSLLNIINLHTTLLTKASRVTLAAGPIPVVDFSLRRTQGPKVSLQAARCSYIAGSKATSNVLAGKLYNIPITGTMAHSFVMSFPTEISAFRAFAQIWKERTILLIDTYDVRKGLENAMIVAKEMEQKGSRIYGVRVDSGDLIELSKMVRKELDKNGLRYLKIFLSGDLDEYKITQIRKKKAPVDGFGVGTHMGTSSDCPYTDVIYKISQIEIKGEEIPALKLSRGKHTLPGDKQVFRKYSPRGNFKEDIIGLNEEELNGEPLLVPMIKKGKLAYKIPPLEETRKYCMENIKKIPKDIVNGDKRYSVKISPKLRSKVSVAMSELRERSRQGLGPVVFIDVDTQNDFIERKGALSVPGASRIRRNLAKLTKLAIKNSIPIIASVDAHSEQDFEFKLFPPHCVKGTPGQEKIKETHLPTPAILSYKKRYSEEYLTKVLEKTKYIIVEKHKLSLFSNPNVDFLLQDVMKAVVYGVATEYCVYEAVKGFLERGIKVFIVIDAIRAVDERIGKKKLKELIRKGAQTIATGEIRRLWE